MFEIDGAAVGVDNPLTIAAIPLLAVGKRMVRMREVLAQESVSAKELLKAVNSTWAAAFTPLKTIQRLAMS